MPVSATSSFSGNSLLSSLGREGVDLGKMPNFFADLAKLRPRQEEKKPQMRARSSAGRREPVRAQAPIQRIRPRREIEPITYVQPGLASLHGGGGIHEGMGYVALRPGEKIPYAAGTSKGQGTGGSGLGSSDIVKPSAAPAKKPEDDERADFFGLRTRMAQEAAAAANRR